LVGRRSRKGVLLAIGLVVFFAGYTWFLDYQEAQVRQRLGELRGSNPDRYLNQIRTVVPFDKYLAEYSKLKGYAEYRESVPPFLLGRWALFPEAKRVGDSYLADECIDTIAFEDARVKMSGAVASTHAAKYRLDGSDVIVQLQDGTDVAVRLVSYGERLHHVELDPPGYDGRRFGYLCK